MTNEKPDWQVRVDEEYWKNGKGGYFRRFAEKDSLMFIISPALTFEKLCQ